MKFGPVPSQPAFVGRPDEALPASSTPPASPSVAQRLTRSTLDSSPPAIADHELLHVIGRGAYGEVWIGRHTRLGTLRAIKIIRRDNFEDSRPFQREFDGIRRFEPISRGHPNLVNILHVGGTDDCFYYVMELADAAEAHGKPASYQCSVISNQSPARNTDYWLLNTSSPHTLRSELKQHGSLPIDRCLEIAQALASALAHLHANGLVHRDVKPSNVIFVGGVVKLADIGLVAGVDDARSFVGTEGYIPPEGPGTPSADCYSLGKLLYELSTGHDRTAWPEPPADLATRPDRERLLELNAILHRACAPDPRERYVSADAMRAELELLQQGCSVKRQRLIERRWAWCKRAALNLAALLAATVILGVAWRTLNRSNNSGDGPPSTNRLANALCANALLALRGDNYAALADAYTNLHRAIKFDTNFARPYVGLFELRSRESVPSLGDASSEEMHWIARKLQELAPDLGATYCAQSLVNFFDWDFPKALEHAQQSVKGNPDYEFGHLWYGFILTLWGRTNEALKETEIARGLRPSKAAVYRSLGHVYYMRRDYTNAIAMYRQVSEWQARPNFYWIGRSYQALSNYREAISCFERSGILSRTGGDAFRSALTEGGPPGYWREAWKRTEKNGDGEFYLKATIQRRLGNTTAAFGWLNKSYETHETNGGCERPLNYLLFDECWDGVRNDPQFQELLDKIGFSKVMSVGSLHHQRLTR